MTHVWREDCTASLCGKPAVGLSRAYRRTNCTSCGIYAQTAERSGTAGDRASSGISWINGEKKVAGDVLNPILNHIYPEGQHPGVRYRNGTTKLLSSDEGHRGINVHRVPAHDETADLLYVDGVSLRSCGRNDRDAGQGQAQCGHTEK